MIFDKSPNHAKGPIPHGKAPSQGLPSGLNGAGIQALQRTLGNRAVTQLVQAGMQDRNSSLTSPAPTESGPSASMSPARPETHGKQPVIQRVVRWDDSWNFTCKSLNGLLVLGYFGAIGRRKTRIQNGMTRLKELIAEIHDGMGLLNTLQPGRQIDGAVDGTIHELEGIVQEYDNHDITYDEGLTLDKQLQAAIQRAEQLLSSGEVTPKTQTLINPNDDFYQVSMERLGMPGFVDEDQQLDLQSLGFLGLQINGDSLTGALHPAVYQQLGLDISNFAQDETKKGRRQNYLLPSLQEAEEAKHKDLVKKGSVGVAEALHHARLSDMVVHGENHHSNKTKAKLMNKIMTKQGDSTLYMEALSEFQPLVDEYASGINLHGTEFPMPELLKRYLDGVDSLVTDREAGSYRALVEAYMKRHKRVVFIDSALAKGGTLEEREASFNQFAFEIIKKDQEENPSDYDILTGAAHAQTQKDHPMVKGLSERLGIKKEFEEKPLEDEESSKLE
jgi:hypothetical protein